MKKWLAKILDKRIGRFLFILLGICFCSGIILGYFQLILMASTKYGTLISIIFILPIVIIYAFYISKNNRLFK